MKKTITILALTLALVLGLTAALPSLASTTVPQNTGVLYLKAEPEIDIDYDQNGNVTGITGRNDTAKQLLEGYTFQGKDTKTVVSEIITLIGNAGYFVEEIDGDLRRITLEILPGSVLPSNVFMDDVIASIKTTVDQYHWKTPLDVDGITDYGMTDYVDTDYGTGNDGVTDYDDTDYGKTDYGRTDYGKTDYDDTDYGPNNDGVTDYNDTPYGQTDYNDSDYGKSTTKKTTNYGATDYDKDTPYDKDSRYGES